MMDANVVLQGIFFYLTMGGSSAPSIDHLGGRYAPQPTVECEQVLPDVYRLSTYTNRRERWLEFRTLYHSHRARGIQRWTVGDVDELTEQGFVAQTKTRSVQARVDRVTEITDQTSGQIESRILESAFLSGKNLVLVRSLGYFDQGEWQEQSWACELDRIGF